MKRQKMVCLVSNDLNQDQRMHKICTTLHQMGFDIRLVGRIKKNSLPLRDTPYTTNRLPCFFERGALFYLELTIRQMRYVWVSQPDIIYCVDADTLLPGYMYKKFKKSTFVFDAHEWFEESHEIYSRPIIQSIWRMILKTGIRKVDIGITVGAELSSILSQKYKIPFHVIRNVPHYEEIPPYPDAHEKTIIYQGMLNRGRGLEEMILALLKLQDYTFEIVGTGDIEGDLKKLVKASQLENRVKFLGFLNESVAKNFKNRSVIGLNLLDGKGKNYYYSLANKTFDYMMAGIPSLQMDFPEYRKIHQDYGTFILLPDLQRDTIVNAIHSIESYSDLSKCNLTAAKIFNWEIESVVLKQLFLSLIS
jgi:glycosyltransferase involved in cell wall biosynthesis